MSSLHYFGAGPAAIPPSVLRDFREAVISYKDSGISLLELPHRGRHFKAILEESSALVRELCELGDDYEVLWLQGGGRLQFCMLPMNFLASNGTAGYVDSGHWANEAMKTAAFYGQVKCLSSSKEQQYKELPDYGILGKADKDLSYVHLTTNNTIYGTQLKMDPECDVPLVADMSSDILGQPRDYSRYDLFYAVAQKNLGIAGVTLVVIKKKWLEAVVRPLPDMLRYEAHAKAGSMLNTPPVTAIYSCLLSLRWLKNYGLQQMQDENERKAESLYAAIDSNPAFHAMVRKEDRSHMNVVFQTKDDKMAKQFLAIAERRGILGIEGHRSVGGFRASIYNAVTQASVDALIEAIHSFPVAKI